MPTIKTKLRRSGALTEYHRFLAFLGQDTARHPQQSPRQIRPLSVKLAKRIARLTKGVHVCPDEPLKGDVIL